jgi:uncharacterized protein (TIGR02271 family)
MEKNENKENYLNEAFNKTIPVIEEEFIIGKKLIETDSIQISKKVFEEEVDADVLMKFEELHIEKKTINQYIDAAPESIRTEGDTTIISVIKEVLVVEKKLMLVEEIYIKKTTSEKTVSVKETLKSEEVILKNKDRHML